MTDTDAHRTQHRPHERGASTEASEPRAADHGTDTDATARAGTSPKPSAPARSSAPTRPDTSTRPATATRTDTRVASAGEQTLTVVTDADTAIPVALRDRLPLILAPPDAPSLRPQEEARDLRAQQAPAALEPVAEACIAAAARGPVLYVASGDGYSAPPEVVAEITELMARRRPDTPFRAVNSGSTLMGCGWQALAAAVVARRPGATLDAAQAAAARVRRRVGVLSMLEFPQFMDLNRDLPSQLTGARAIVRLDGDRMEVLERPLKRAAALTAFCTLAEQEIAGPGGLRLAIHHGGAEPAARALALWAERTLDPEDLEIAPLTHHAATRIGPLSLTLAWYRTAEDE